MKFFQPTNCRQPAGTSPIDYTRTRQQQTPNLNQLQPCHHRKSFSNSALKNYIVKCPFFRGQNTSKNEFLQRIDSKGQKKIIYKMSFFWGTNYRHPAGVSPIDYTRTTQRQTANLNQLQPHHRRNSTSNSALKNLSAIGPVCGTCKK